jgi:phosphoribosylamine--glycine ligase
VKILVVGNGGREHAIAWKFSLSTRQSGLFCAPGNAGTAGFATNLENIASDDIAGVCAAVEEHSIDLVFIGPEVPLSLGMADELRARGVLCVGPGKDGARLESSKAYSKDFMVRHGIPTAEARIFDNADDLESYLKSAEYPLVVKKSGLAAGKGVLETDSPRDAMDFAREHIDEGRVVIEEYLTGYEVSIFALSDGTDYRLLAEAADYKKAGENNSGPNTGGMGVVCPVPWFDGALMPGIERDIIAPTFEGLRNDGIDFKGILYFGLMITDSGPKVLEYNVRFGDPEAQALAPLIENDFCNLFEAVAAGSLSEHRIRMSSLQSLCVVVAAAGYPGPYSKGAVVDLSAVRPSANQILFHAATEFSGNALVTGGGRCFAAVGTGSDFLKARSRSYELASAIRFDGAWFRKDIGNRIFGNGGILSDQVPAGD